MKYYCKICRYVHTRKNLITHYRVKHKLNRTGTLTCFYPKCCECFRSFSAFNLHVHRKHKSQTFKDIITCSVCKNHSTRSPKDFIHHLQVVHLSKYELITCPFIKCDFTFRNGNTFRSHINRHHPDYCDSDISLFKKSVEHINQNHATSSDEELTNHQEENILEYNPDLNGNNQDSSVSSDTFSLGVVDENDLKQFVGLFLLKLQAINQVPNRTIQDILLNISEIHELSKYSILQSIKKVTDKYDISCEVSNEISTEILENYPLYRLTKQNTKTDCNNAKSGDLSTQALRTKFVKENLPFVQPIEYDLGIREGKNRTCVYIPIISVLRKLLSKHDILRHVVNEEENDPNIYSSYKSGRFYKNNRLFQNESFSLIIALYQDDFEVANPLGTSRKIHKVSAFYWVLANVPYKYRSALHMIQTAVLCKSADVKYFGFSEVLKPFLRDLIQLENEGVYVDLLGKEIKGTLAYISADNLGAHSIGGFLECFSSTVEYFCRFCMITSKDLKQDINTLRENQFVLRTKTLHGQHLAQLQENGGGNVGGVKRDCCFHEISQNFHVCSGLPPDIAHDLLEGTVPYELALCLSLFIQKKYITIVELNDTIRHYPYLGNDAVNRPQQISGDFSKKDSLGGNATENRTLLRLLPIFIGNKVPTTEPVWDLILSLKQIVELCFAPTLTEVEIDYLEFKISSHLLLFRESFPDKSLKPKHHFIQHYPLMIKCFGPLLQCATIRFEGKHKYFKSVLKRAQCFKNVCKTLCEQHQLAQAFYLSEGKLCKPELVYYDSQLLLTGTVSDIELSEIRNAFGCLLKLFETQKVLIDSVVFKPGLFVIYDKDILPVFGRIRRILLYEGGVYLMLENQLTCCDEHTGDYVLQATDNINIVNVDKCLDSFPLQGYTVHGKLYVPLKHWVSFQN